MRIKQLKVEYYLPPSKLELKYRSTPESVYVKIHLPPYIEDGKKKYRPYRFSICKVIPQYFGKVEENYKYDIITVHNNRLNNSPFRDASGKINDALDEISKQYGYNLPNNDILINEINRLIGRGQQEVEVPNATEEVKSICLITAVNERYHKMVTISKQNRLDSCSEHTIHSYRSMVLNIQKYHDDNGAVNLLKLTNDQWDAMWEVILTYKKGVGNYKFTTLRLQQKQLRAMLKKRPNGDLPLLNLNDDLFNMDKDPINEHTQIFFTENELKVLIKASFDHPDMEYARKYLIIASLTGQRYQSMKNMSNCKIVWNAQYGFFYAHFEHIKTGTHCYCPLFDDVVKLCPDNVFLNFDKTNQNSQYWIDKVVVELGLKKGINISSHTCKKTFVSLLKPYRITNETLSLVTHPDVEYSESCVGDYDKSDLIYKSETFYEATKGIVDKYPDTVFRYGK
ncbi:hypothetical protein [Flavobacterium sp. ACAM 123]|uniref:hypothetical protein n=1 Tax=Flavobacterium sp. ACAM 123 TaxID=1189620 RepID=UPI00031C09C5|nr:hypothetical protein [Flavobacterium sp. ACAM 123]